MGSKRTLATTPDQHHRVINRYGLLNPEGKGWPHPATYVIDQEGIVRWTFVEVNYKVRATNDMILDALQALPWQPTQRRETGTSGLTSKATRQDVYTVLSERRAA